MREIFFTIVICALLYIGSHLCVLSGVLKERESRNCINASELLMWENTLKTAHAICVDVQHNQLEEIKSSYKERVDILEEEVEKWKNYYYYQRDLNQQEVIEE